MFNYISQSGTTSYDVVELVADTRADVTQLPTKHAAGSTCLVIEDSSVWMLDSQETWKEI